MTNTKMGYTTNTGIEKKKVQPVNTPYTDNILNSGTVAGSNAVSLPELTSNSHTTYAANVPAVASSPEIAPVNTFGASYGGEQTNTPVSETVVRNGALYSSGQAASTSTGTESGAPTGTETDTGTSGGTGTEDVKTLSYEEYMANQSARYKEMYETLLKQIEEDKQNAIKQAETERERAIIDARSNQELNKATYGANAEALAGMGLTGSGYSDYMNQQAYATQRAESQSANAQSEAAKLAAERQASSDKMNANLTYAENMADIEGQLVQYNEQKTAAQKEQYLNALASIESGAPVSTAEIKALRDSDSVSQSQYDELVKAYQKREDLSISEEMFNDLSDKDAQKYYEDVMSDELLSEEQKAKIKDAYENKGVLRDAKIFDENTISFNWNAGDDTVDGKAGDNFSVKVNGEKLRIEKGHKASEALNNKLDTTYKKQKGTNAKKHNVMVYDGKIYMRLGKGASEGWYIIQQRSGSYAKHFSKLCEALGVSTYDRGYKDPGYN